MAARDSVTPDNSETERPSIKNRLNKKEATPPKDESNDNGEVDEEGEEEEYEIEAILDAKKGTFADGRYGYLVKWKGYDETHNSWVDELDAGNAGDLIKAFQAKMLKKQSRKSLQKADRTSSREPKSEVKKKRGRLSEAAREESTDQEDNSEEDSKSTLRKRPRKSTPPVGRSASKKKRISPSAEPEDNGIEGFTSMDKWMDLDSWEELVEKVDTVERQNGNEMKVYFTLTTGERTLQPSEICSEKFPRKMLRFYESHLRWIESTDPPSAE